MAGTGIMERNKDSGFTTVDHILFLSTRVRVYSQFRS